MYLGVKSVNKPLVVKMYYAEIESEIRVADCV